MLVYVINQHGKPLMPTTPRKARLLLKSNQAKIKTHNPFTIQLLHGSSGYKQPISLGIDPGFKFIGFSATTDKSELISGEVKIDQNISKRVQLRKHFRQARRRRLWYRKPRFQNRTRSEGWLAPSVEHKVQTHKSLIEKLQTILPITQIIIEENKFDIQKLENPNIKGIEYQQGTLQGYEIREYLLEKYKRTCVYCRAKNIPLQVEHIIPRSRGGSNRVSNLTIACNDCNQAKGNQTAEEFGYPEVQAQVGRSYIAATQMNIISKRLGNSTFGKVDSDLVSAYTVKFGRAQLGLEKSHTSDAFIISGGATQTRLEFFDVKQTRRNNRKLELNRKRYGRSVREQRHKINRNALIEYHVRGEVKPRLFRVGSTVGSVRLRFWDAKFEKFRELSTSKVQLISYGKGLNSLY